MPDIRATAPEPASRTSFGGWQRTTLVTALAAMTLLLMSVPALPIR